ncbi:vitamin K epoxide reductase family protein [Streptomyces sannanensis]|uniref:Vitamin K epoxide reductase family protein n=1 Tax=Streptomyces sannanensis TaxID=285536 RepID=A0ABP6S512_9ACTN
MRDTATTGEVRTIVRPGADARTEGAARRTTGAGRAFAWLLTVTGALGILASFVITIDKMRLAENPDFRPSCSIGPVLSCTNVMLSDQASVFGFPNPLLGLVAYPVVVMVGVALLVGARFPGWLWIGLNLGTLFGAVFCMWLMTQALYVIGALCLWCCLAWAVTVTMFWYTTVHNLRHGIVPAPRRLVIGLMEFHWAVPVAWLLSIVMLIAVRFWSYWQSLLV